MSADTRWRCRLAWWLTLSLGNCARSAGDIALGRPWSDTVPTALVMWAVLYCVISTIEERIAQRDDAGAHGATADQVGQ